MCVYGRLRRDRLPPPNEDEYYYADLVGLEAVTAMGDTLGRVATVSNYGAGDILEIAPEGGGETLLVPFTRAVAPTIDFEAGRIVIEPPEEIARLPGRSSSRTTEVVYRRELRPVLTTGAEAMDRLFKVRHPNDN